MSEPIVRHREFLAGGGKTGALMRGHDWSRSPLGEPAAWPAMLQTATSLMLGSKFPMFVAWGEELGMLYNDSYAEILGDKHPDALGARFAHIWSEIWDEILPMVERALAGEAVYHEDLPLTVRRRGAAEQAYFTFCYSPLRDAQGISRGMFCAVAESTSKVLSENALRQVNELLEARVEERTRALQRTWRMSQDLLVVANADGTLQRVNAAWTKLLGWTANELVGRSFTELTHPDDLAATEAAFADILHTPLTAPYEYRLRHADGSYRWFAWTGALEEGAVYANGRDTTRDHEHAASLLRTEEALRQSQKMDAVGQLAGGLAHDFNNLLAGIGGSLELMQARVAQGRTGDLARYVGVAQGALKRAAALTHRLLAFSRRQTLEPKPTNVNRLVAGMEELIRRSVGPNIVMEFVGAAGLWHALIDPPQLESALLNLCINARDAMPDGGRITVETANKWVDERGGRELDMPPGQYLTLCVSDAGSGMTPEVLARATDPFFTTKPIGQGTGLGLSMIYGFVRQSGGQLRIYTEVGQGTTVCLYLPRHYGASEEADTPPNTHDMRPGRRCGTVLVVDDEPTVRVLIMEVLEDAGYAALEAADSLSGLKILQSDAPLDLLITDVGLPGGMNGRQLADAARDLRPGLTVLFITGYAENAVVGNGHLEPWMHLLTKPFPMEVLARRVSELVPGGRAVGT